MNQETMEERKTPGGYTVRVHRATMTYEVISRRGTEIPRNTKNNSSIIKVPRIIFLGHAFNLSHFRLADLTYVNAKSSKLQIPYQYEDSPDIKIFTVPTGSDSDVLPIIPYQYQTLKEVVHAAEQGLEFHNIIVDESSPKNEMVNLKIRFPNVNILILRKKA
ncbi:MAG: hypothetical protein IPL26_06225 [Leptospiraceae bacterium]|nr:hypothetical protein [Leptospiraceae bacterium]